MLNDKLLALTQCYSAKAWATLGINLIDDIMDNRQPCSWEELGGKFDIPSSHKKTFSLISKVVGPFFLGKVLTSNQFLEQLKWKDDTSFLDIKVKQIYHMLKDEAHIIA